MMWKSLAAASALASFAVASEGTPKARRMSTRTAGKRPLFMYVNANVSWNGSMCDDIMWNIDNGATHVMLSFLINGVPDDAVIAWEQLGDAGMKSCVDRAHAAGGHVLLATGGATEVPYHTDAAQYGRTAAEQALRLHLDGVDFDLENLPAGFGGIPMYMDWLRASTDACRQVFDQSGRAGMEITHAPQAPYFSAWSSDGYVKLAQEWGDKVDFYLIQYYNQESCKYEDYDSLFVRSGSCSAVDEAIPELAAKIGTQYGHKLVVGKPALLVDVYNTGYVAPAQLNEFLCRAEAETGYTSGLMAWSYRGKDEPLMKEYYDAVGGSMCNGGGERGGEKGDSEVPVEETSGCYVASVWWTSDCLSQALCRFDASVASKGGCTGSGKMLPVWATSESDCRAQLKGVGCL